MKWLVKTLDYLTNYTSPEETAFEQGRLENLISRYKNLIPVVEITMVKTEVFSKCYSYKREVNEIVNLLKKVKEKTSSLPPPQNINQLVSLIDEQQYTMNQLEKQRIHVVQMVQRGKDLSKDAHAPEFIFAELKSLETGWNDTFNESFEKLNKLKATHHVWQQYIASKSELSTFFNEAERELRSVTPLQCQPLSVLNDIQIKKSLENRIENSLKVSMQKIDELHTKLVPLVAVEQQMIIQKEIEDDHNRLDNILDHVKHRVQYLEDYNHKWKEYKSRLDELHAWAAKIARQELEYIKTSIQSPDEKLARINVFKEKLDQQLHQLEVVNEIGQKLDPKEGNRQEAEKLLALSTEVHNLLNELQQNVNREEQKLSANIVHWNELNSVVAEIKAFLVAAEAQTEQLNARKPHNFDEVEEMKQKLVDLISSCNGHITNLQTVMQKSEPVAASSEFPENLDNYLCKLQTIRESSKANAEKCNKLEANLNTFDSELQKLQSWYNKTADAVVALVQAEQNDEVAINNQLSKLKSYATEIDESQAKLIQLFQIVNMFSHSMAPSIAQAGNTELNKVKTDLVKLSDKVAAAIDKTSKLISHRQDFIQQTNNMNDWMQTMRHQIENVDYVDTRNLQDALSTLTSYAKDIKKKNAELEQMSGQYPNELVCKTLTTNMLELVTYLKDKEKVLKDMINFVQWRDTTTEKLAQFARQDSVENLQLADQLKKSIGDWKEKVVTIENNPALHAKTEQASLFSPIACVWDMEKRYQQILEALEAKRNEKESLNEKKNEFESNKQELIGVLNEQKKRFESILQQTPNISNIEQLISDLRKLTDLVDQNRNVKEKLHFSGGIIIREDASLLPYIQDALNTLDKEWDNLQVQTNEVLQTYIELQYALQEFITNRNEFIKDSQAIIADLKKVEQSHFQIKDDLVNNQRNLQKHSESIKNCDDNVEHIEKTGNIINEIFTTIKKPSQLDVVAETRSCKQTVANIKQQINQQSEKLNDKLKQLDEIELWHEDILRWLSDIKKYMENALHQTTEMEYAAISLSRYRDEFPAYQQLQTKMMNQIQKLREQNMGQLPKCLESVEPKLIEQFGTVNSISEQLQKFLSSFNSEESELKANVVAIKNKINKLRDLISKCDDLSGESDKIIERITNCQQIQRDVTACGVELGELNKCLAVLGTKYPFIREGGALPRELAAIKIRYDNIVTSAATVEHNLSNYLKKMEMIKIAKLQAIITDCQDKLKWCVPEKNCDNHNMNMKVDCLNDIAKSLKDAATDKEKITTSFSVLQPMFQPSDIENLSAEKGKVFAQLEQLQKDYLDHFNSLTSFTELQQKFIQLSFALSSSLKDLEDKLKSEANYLIALTLLGEKIQHTANVKADLQKYEPSITELQALYTDIDRRFPGIIPKPVLDQIQVRYVNLVKANDKLLQQLKDCEKKYNAYTNEIESFMQDKTVFEAQVKEAVPGSQDNMEKSLEAVKLFKINSKNVEKYLNNANEIAETMYNEITPDCRKVIRNQLASLRNEFNVLNKNLQEMTTEMENKLRHRKSIIEQISCIKNWLQQHPEDSDTNDDLLFNTLQDKKNKLSQLKLYAQEVNANALALNEVEKKNPNADEKSKKEIHDTLKTVSKRAKNADKKIALLQKYIKNHESHDLLVEKTKDIIYALVKKAEPLFIAEEEEPANNEEKSLILNNIISTRETIESQQEKCQKSLESVLPQTHTDGHEPLQSALRSLQIKWQDLLGKSTNEAHKLDESAKNLKLYGDQLEMLNEWLNKAEKIVKDTVLKGSLELKKKHLSELKSIDKVFPEKQENFRKIENDMKETFTPLTGKLKTLADRFQNMHKSNKDAISKYEQFVRNHNNFNQLNHKFSSELDQDIKMLAENSHITGDLRLLKDRSAKVRELANKRIKDVLTFEYIFEEGEKVCLQSNTDGSSTVRQELKILKAKNDEFLDNLNTTAQRLEECLLQFEEFSVAQEQLSKWLSDVEKTMRAHTDLKSTLSEKRIQLQNQKIMHQEMLLQNSLVTSVCDKAQLLVEQTKDPSLTSYIDSIKELFQNIIEKSKGLLENLEHCLEVHTDLNNVTTHLRNWINENKQSLTTYAGLPSDKNEIKKQIKQFEEMRDKKAYGQKMMDAIDEKFKIVALTTSPQGCATITEDIDEIHELLKDLFVKIDKSADQCKQELVEYEQFEKELEELTKWCKVKENSFKSQELMSTTGDKEAQFNKFKTLLNEISNLEKRIDSFLENCATLIQKSGIEKIKNLSNQLSNRYQLLQVLAKEVVKRAQNIYENNKKYDDKLQNTQNMLDVLEAELADRQNIALDMDQVKEKLANCDICIHNVVSISETVLPETSASGREVIRQQIKDIKDRYDKNFIDCKDIANKVHVEALQRSACQELSDQITAWLQTMEHNLKKRPAVASLQECRSASVKYKSYQHEIASQNRQILTLKEKLANLQAPSDIESIEKRYNTVKDTCEDVLTKLDNTLQYLTHYNDLYKALDDNQKHLWSLLSSFSIMGGNKSNMQQKLSKLLEINNIAIYEPKLAELKQLIEANSKSNLLADSMATKMKTDSDSLNNEYAKLRSSLNNILQQINDSLRKWDDYQTVSDTLKFWLESTEDKLKNFGLRDTLEEKEAQYQQFLTINNEVLKKETDFETLSDQISELSQISSMDVPANRQLNLRFQTVKTTSKECLKKCESALNIYKAFEQKIKDVEIKLSETEIIYNQQLAEINANDRAVLDKQLQKAIAVLKNGQQINEIFNEINEINESIYATSNPKGQELVGNKVNKLQKQYEELFDKIRFQKKLIEQKLASIGEFNEEIEKFRAWLREFKKKLGDNIKLQDTLDAKINQQQEYNELSLSANQHQKELLTLKHIFENIAILPNSNNTELNTITKEFETNCNNAEQYGTLYEKIVNDHQNYCKAVMELQEFLEAAANTVDLCSDLDLERVSLYTNLERLMNFQKSLSTELETALINQISQLGEEVIPNTAEDGQINIRAQIDSSQQEWEALVQLTQNTIKAIEDRIQSWNNYDKAKETYSSWMRDIDSKLHAIDLKPTLNEKQAQLKDLKHLQGEIKAKELEIDDLTEKAYALQKGIGGSGKTSSLIPDLYVKYQQVFAKIQKMVNQWTGYCNDHHQFNQQVVETAEWLDAFKRQLDFCSNPNVSAEKDLREKRNIMNNLIASKEEGSNRIQAILESASNTISNTASDGHDAINSVVNGFNAQWSQLMLKIVEVKSNLDDSVHQWAGFLDQVQTMKNAVDWLNRELQQCSELRANFSEKRAALEHIRTVEEKARSEMQDVNALKPKMNEMINLGLQTPATVEAQEIIETVEDLAKQIIALCKDREDQYRDHRIFKEAFEDLQNWLSRAREKFALVQEQSLNDRLNSETTLHPLQAMLNKKPQGELLLEQVYQNFEIVLTSTSNTGKSVMQQDMKNIKETFDTLFKDIQIQKEVIENAAGIYRNFKDDVERISEWLQQMDILVKNNKLALLSTKEEKLKKVEEMKEVLHNIEKGREDIAKLNKFAEPLLKTHLANQTQVQLRHINSRYEVQLNLGKDVLSKVGNNYEEHKTYEQLYNQSSSWINNAKDVIRQATEAPTDVSKEILEKRLQQVQVLLGKKPEGQSLLHNTINYGEKILRNTKSDGKDVINSQLKELQSDWDRCIKKMSTAKVQLETSILQWSDYNSKYNHLTQWIRDREMKLTQVAEPQKTVKQPKEGHSKLSSGLNEKKANLQFCDDIVQGN
jgi:nesprin-1